MNMAHLPPEPRPSVPIPDSAAQSPDRARTETWRDRTDSAHRGTQARSRWKLDGKGKEPRQRGPSMRIPQISTPSESMALASLPVKALMPNRHKASQRRPKGPSCCILGFGCDPSGNKKRSSDLYLIMSTCPARKIHPGRFVLILLTSVAMCSAVLSRAQPGEACAGASDLGQHYQNRILPNA